MHEITENATLELTNVLSYRGKVTQQQLGQISKEIDELLASNNVKRNGSNISATFSVETSNGTSVADIELLIPLERAIHVPSPYKIKPIFRLKNAVKIRHTGNPASIQDTAQELMKYISDKQLMPITTGYNVTVQEPNSPHDVDGLIVDIYIGVCDNIL